MGQITGRLRLVQDLQEAMECLLYCLELDRGSVSSGELDISAVHRDGECQVYSSQLGVSLVAQVIGQQVGTKLELAQHLLVLQQLTLATGAGQLSPSTLDMIQSTFLPRTTVMVHCYVVMSWLCVAPLAPAPQSAVQQSLRQLAVLKLGDGGNIDVGSSSSGQTQSLVEMFISSSAGDNVRSVVGDPWLLALPPLAIMTAQLLWPR